MANRVLLGKHAGLNDWGLWVSRPGQDVTGTTHNNFAFRTDISDGLGNVTSAEGKTFTVKDHVIKNVTFGANEKVKFVTHDYNRSLFSDGSTDRCPLVLVSTTVRGDYNTQNAVGFMYYTHNGGKYRTSQGFRYRHFPFYTTTQGRVQINVQAEARAVYASGTEAHYNMTGLSEADWPGTDTSQRSVYIALCDLELR